MAHVPLQLPLLFACFHTTVSLNSVAEITREGQVLVRQDTSTLEHKASVLGSSAADDRRPTTKARLQKEAGEALRNPHKIDDSWFSLRMPDVIEKNPNLSAASFVGAALVFLFGVCFKVQYDDYKEATIRAHMRVARREAMNDILGMAPRRMAGAQAPTSASLQAAHCQAAIEAAEARATWQTPSLHPTPEATQWKAGWEEDAEQDVSIDEDVAAVSDDGLSDVAFSDVAFSEAAQSVGRSEAARSVSACSEAAGSERSGAPRSHGAGSDSGLSDGSRSRGGRSDGLRSHGTHSEGARYFEEAPNLTAAENLAAVAEKGMQGMATLSEAVGNFTGVLAGENTKMPNFNPLSSADDTTASGTSTPRSGLSSQVSGDPAIQSGTVLKARVPEVIFASTTSWQEIGELAPGKKVVAAGPPEVVDSYTMVPIRPRGAVDLKTLEVRHHQ